MAVPAWEKTGKGEIFGVAIIVDDMVVFVKRIVRGNRSVKRDSVEKLSESGANGDTLTRE
eukprot:scaffold184112_cov28-Attheya_sp.AAC.1